MKNKNIVRLLPLWLVFSTLPGTMNVARAEVDATATVASATRAAPVTNNADTDAAVSPLSWPEAAVAPFGAPAFYIYAKLGPFTPEERAENLVEKINLLDDDLAFTPEQLRIAVDGALLDIVYKNIIIMSVSDADAAHFRKSKAEVAAYYREAITGVLAQHRQDTRLWTVLSKIGMVLAILAVLFLIIKYVNRAFFALRRKIVSWRGTHIKGLRIKSYAILDENRCVAIILFGVKIIKYLSLLILLYVAITLLFSVFPETRGLAARLLDYVVAPFSKVVFGVIAYVPNAIAVIVIVTIFRYLLKGIKYFAEEIDRERLVIKGFYADWAMPTYNLARILLCAFMLVVIFPYLPNSDSKIFQGVSVFIGVIVSLGSTSLIGNLIAGLVLTYMRPFQTGDFIKIGDITGTVREKSYFATRITTVKNEEVTIPNSNIMSAHTINYSHSSREKRLILWAAITFGYDTPWRQIHDLLLRAAAQTKGALTDPAPFVLQHALGDAFVEYHINIYVADDKRILAIYSELYENIQDVFQGAGLDMVCPAYQNFRGDTRIRITPDAPYATQG